MFVIKGSYNFFVAFWWLLRRHHRRCVTWTTHELFLSAVCESDQCCSFERSLLTGTVNAKKRVAAQHPVTIWLNFTRGRLKRRGRHWKGGTRDDARRGGSLADKNYPFKVEKRYKSAVKLSNGSLGRFLSYAAVTSIIGK